MKNNIYKDWSKNDLIDEIDKLKKRKKYGLVWETKEKEKVVLKCQKEFPIINEITSKEIKSNDDSNFNLLIEGDNYHSLSVLNYTHSKSVDIIYIDPPYNRGGDFIYNDKFIEKTDSYKHSKWVSYMYKRLFLCKELLSEKGIIFISIDENEFAQLKIICDEIFKENQNGIFVWQKKYGGSNDSGNIATEHEYILSYSKTNSSEPWLEPHDDKYLKRYKEQDKLGRFYWDTLERPGLKSPILVKVKFKNKIYKLKTFRSQARVDEEIKRGEIKILQLNNGKISFQFKQRLRDGKLPRSILRDNKDDIDQDLLLKIGSNSTAKKELLEIFGKEVFSNPKPTNLIMYLISLIKNKNATILDFFAGSGTTGHAVLKLNKIDNGNRKFILCTNNENNICENVTYPRLLKVNNGYKHENKKSDPLNFNLKYFKTNFVSSDHSDKNKINLTKKATEMICIKENTFDNISNSEKIKIFKNQSNFTIIIYDQLIINEVKKMILKFDGIIKIYIFSLGNDLFEDEFAEFENVEVEPIPEPIFRIYKRLFR